MRVIPRAVGQSDGALVLWQDSAELADCFTQTSEVVTEVRWGIGVLDEDACLILYLFRATETLEVYLPQALPTSPQAQIDVWKTIYRWQPQVVKLRYGHSPAMRDGETTFLLPTQNGETAVEKLQAFLNQMKTQRGQGLPSSHEALLRDLEAILTSGHENGASE